MRMYRPICEHCPKEIYKREDGVWFHLDLFRECKYGAGTYAAPKEAE